MKRPMIAILAVFLCFTSVVGFCACNSSPEIVSDESGKGTPAVVETTNNSGDETHPAVEYKSSCEDDLDRYYCSLAIGRFNTYNYGPDWDEKDFDLCVGLSYYLIYADPGQDFDIPVSLDYTLGYHIKDFDLEVTLAEGDEKSLEVVSVDKYKALNGGPECPGITVRSLEPGVARVYIKLTYIPTGDSSTHQAVVVVRDS